MTSRTGFVVAIAAITALAGCSGGDDDAPSTEPTASLVAETADDQFPSIVEVATTYNDDGTWNFAVTLTSPYDTPERYADGWRVVDADGTTFGVHTLTHDHASEQPFTRRQSGVEIPDEVDEVTIEGRDLVNGFGGATQTVTLVREASS